MRGDSLVRVWLLAWVLVLGACTAPPGGGPQCTFDSDCEGGLVCASGYCRVACMTNADCAPGSCHVDPNSSRRVCIPQGAPTPCRYASECGANEICTRDGQCRPQCVADYDCRVTNPFASCVDGQVCRVVCGQGRGNCDEDDRNGCEVDTASSADHCGACGTVCPSAPHARGVCASGRCAIACEAPFADCDGDPANGCEEDLSQPTNCGACGARCQPPTPLCAPATATEGPRYRCAAVCAAPSPDLCAGVCTDRTADPRHCGRCENVCPSGASSTAVCASGACGLQCDPGAGDCDSDPANGCEVTLSSSAANCGACGAACPTGANATATCAESRCALVCEAGFANCDLDDRNGCEVDTRADPDHCGACSNQCERPSNGGAVCAEGRCGISCGDGYADCDRSAANGCETDTRADAANCGACGAACAPANATGACVAGSCGVARCNAGFADCDGDPSNGCEVDTRASPTSCGRCGNACPSTNGAATCRAGVCAITCAAGYGDCDGDPANGCETDTRANALHCGACGTACSFPNAGARCNAGRCESTRVCSPTTRGDCDGDPANGCETDLLTAAANCGACGAACALANATATCAGGRCGVASCAPGFADCDGNPANGCEVDTRTSAAHCGRCGGACSSANGTPSCRAGVCAIACAAGYGDCDGNPANGCETNTNTSVSSCGRCGGACNLPNAVPSCGSGRCAIAACAAGYGDCDGNPANGCEVDLRTAPSHCGACGNACASTNGAATCAMGACGINCSTGYGNCDGNAANGCEVNTGTSTAHCGACGRACSAANGAAVCASGACAVGSCNAGYGNCDGNAANGCETNTGTSTAHCGACGRACVVANATAACAAGLCAVGSCNAGFGDCDNNAANGCETDLRTTPTSCGACGRACSVANAAAGCAAGACTVGSCNAGFGDCDGNAANGCEVDMRSSNSHCGACGRACAAGTVCSNGACGSVCAAGLTYCSGVCVDTRSDASNCGSCGGACPQRANASPTCGGGMCGFRCNPGFGDCDGNAANGCEVNLGSATAHCGACGNACNATNGAATCSAGTCGITCSAGFGNCDGDVTNGCETDTRTTVVHCGACGRGCSVANGVAGCAAGACTVASCNAGYADCDGNAANGCETNLNTSTASCGRCGNACSSTNGTASCVGGACGIACGAGFGNCDGNAANGCETDTRGDVNHCGACGARCSLANAVPGCSAGRCTILSCATNWGDCDGNPANGCETNLLTSPAHCGRCGGACSLANATPACAGGACTVGSCNAGFGNCDGNASNGCETNTRTTPAHCGGCGNACTVPNATPACSGGACAVGSCNAGFGNCDGNASNGCETDVSSSAAHCGACGNACGTGFFCASGVCTRDCGTLTNCSNVCVNTATNPAHCGGCGAACPPRANASATCARSVCGFACNTGYGNCDGNATNGCETDIRASVAHCGGCGLQCAPANATGACAAGVCGVGTCAAGYGNCDNNATNGCETNTLTSVSNCGACGNACSLPNATPVCASGACAISACLTGFGNCDNNATNGCETNIYTSTTNCGGCGTVCSYPNAAAVCTTGRCGLGACNAGFGNCDQSSTNGCERNLSADVSNCGACGRVCPRVSGGVQTCVNSVCGYTCSAGYYDTGSGCARILAPRPLFPMSTSRVTSQRPTLRWAAAAAPVDGARLQVCRDRACATVLVQQDLTATSYTLTTTLTAGVYYWRLYGRVGTSVGTLASPVWEFFVGARTAARATARDTVPDFNGDGVADVVVGAPGTDRVYVYYGTTNGPPSTASLVLAGATSGGGFGSTVSSAGDVNGDGFGDLLVAETNSALAHVFLGGATGLSTARTTLSHSASAGFGNSSSWAGDTNGDGYGDVVIGASRSMRALAFHGGATGISTSPARIYTSTQPGFGTLVRGVGTLNDDDLSDIVVTSTTGWSTYLGTATSAVTYVSLANIRDIHAAGDVNGDGRSDVIVATWLYRVGLNALHVTRVHHGIASGVSATASRTYTESGVSNGAAVAGIEDVNNDGYGDVAVSAQGSLLHVYYGSSTGAGTSPTNISLPRWADGTDVAAAGDINGDGRDDMIVGFPDSGCEFSGSFYVRIFRGGATAISTGYQQLNAPNTQCSSYGVTVASALPAALWRVLWG
ncbi:MAG: FG-GAP-like repeat-containing protein [Polyangiales bacterium]